MIYDNDVSDVSRDDVDQREVIIGIITDIDLLKYVTSMEQGRSQSPSSPRSGDSKRNSDSDESEVFQ